VGDRPYPFLYLVLQERLGKVDYCIHKRRGIHHVDLLQFHGIGFLKKNKTRLEVLAAVKMSKVVFWVVTPCGLAGGCKCIGGTYCLHL
jgi:hypothetical protein